jgi:hypothetical protein
MDLNKLITKKINEYALNGDANLLEQYGFLITMIAKEYAAEQLILSGVSHQRELLIAYEKEIYSKDEWIVFSDDRIKIIDKYLSNL